MFQRCGVSSSSLWYCVLLRGLIRFCVMVTMRAAGANRIEDIDSRIAHDYMRDIVVDGGLYRTNLRTPCIAPCVCTRAADSFDRNE